MSLDVKDREKVIIIKNTFDQEEVYDLKADEYTSRNAKALELAEKMW